MMVVEISRPVVLPWSLGRFIEAGVFVRRFGLTQFSHNLHHCRAVTSSATRAILRKMVPGAGVEPARALQREGF